MPYIDSDAKWALSGDQSAPPERPRNVGELTYALQQVILDYLLDHGLRYQQVAEVTGALSQAQRDFNERVVEPYEAKKRAENGERVARVIALSGRKASMSPLPDSEAWRGNESIRDEFRSEGERPTQLPTDYIPIMRQHLAEGLMAMEASAGKEAAEDLAQSYREGKMVLHESKLSGKLGRSIDLFRLYLSDEEDEDEQLPEA